MVVNSIIDYISDVASVKNTNMYWAETIAFYSFFLAAIVMFASRFSSSSYICAILIGLLVGRFVYRNHAEGGSIVVTFGVLLGILLGSIGLSLISITVLYILSVVVAYKLHDRKIIQSVDV